MLRSKILVLGLARSGRAAIAAALALGSEVIAHDQSTAVDLVGLEGVDAHLGLWSDELLSGVAHVVKSPGVPDEAAAVVAAHRAGIAVISEIELGARLLPNPILGVTGTNGKTTTTALLGAIFEAAEIPVEVAGNIGRPLSSLVGVCRPVGVDRVRALVVPARGCRDAAAAHRGADQSRAGSSRSARHVRGVCRGEAPACLRTSGRRRCRRPPDAGSARCPARQLASSSRETTRFRRSRSSPAPTTARTQLRLPPRRRAAGIDDAAIAKALASFPGVEHRIEEIAVVDGVRYVNDSKATNAAAALRALASFPGVRKHVILGGRGKAEPYDALAAAFEAGDRAYLIGEGSDTCRGVGEARGAVRSSGADSGPGGFAAAPPRRPHEPTSCSFRPPAPRSTSS